MWIKRLQVTDWAGIASAAIDLEPGLNVLHGPNELGKSSLVNAIRAALLLQSTSAAAAPLRDWHADAPPRVALTFEQEAQRVWRVRKSFGSSGHAYLELSRDGSEFTQEGKGREVDGTLRRILRWGLKGPGLPGGKHGMAESFITTALLGEQSDVVAILRTSLAGDGDDSGRERLSEALQALAEDPRFKRVLAAVQEKVDEAFTASGRKRTGQASPWAQIRGQRVAAEANERDVRQQLEESESARLRTKGLHEQLLAAESARQRADRVLAALESALARRKARDAAEAALAAAEAECGRVQGLFDRRDRNVAAIAAAGERVSGLEKARAEAQAAAESVNLRVGAAREQVRRLETGAGEQQRRLREEEAKNQRLELERSQQGHEQKVARAQALAKREEEIAALAADVDKRETELEEREGLLRDAVAAAARDRDEIGVLEVERQCARYLGAVSAARASTAALDAAREHARQAAALERKAAATREEAADLHAPAGAELDHLRSLETDWRIAREKLAVGLAVEVALERGGTAEVSIDGESRQVRIDAGEPAALEAKRELRLDLTGIGVVHVRGGGRDLLREAAAAEERWNGAAKPVLARAGCTTLPELEALRTRADALLETASGLERQAEQERARAENLDELERRAVVAKANVEQRRAALAELLNDGESVEEHVSGRDEQPRDETFLEQSIARLEAVVREREELRQQLERAVAGEEREVASRRRDLADKQAEQRKAQDAGDWRQVLAGTRAEGDRLRREIEAVDAELAKIRIEATTEVEQARRALADLDGEEHRARETLRETTERWTAARDELARLQGEAAELRATTQHEDIEAVRVLRDRRRADLDALPAPSIEVDPERLAGAKDAATAAAADVRQLEMHLRAAEGALEQVGGQYIQERAQQAREAVVALEERERELDLDYGAWRLLQEALTEAEQEEAVHLGNALVQPVSERVAALTGGRYGQVTIGPQLDAAGIQTAGGERKFDVLSVGTQEQIALLLRLSIAEALEAFIVLDDQLTQSDPERMTWMRDLLEAAASRIQVVVMTCHPEHYAVENGRRHVVDLSSCVQRRTVAAAPRIGG
ncbi:MAG: AAA family ATPase [Acidobacteria bacterium]|nr:AAA family ATPase [Acidobacteriota bacterium]